ncbi:MAG TPA: hypothetical protein VID73_01155 [Ktedonobacterales bacterium]|jgi:hypothetical protein
MDPYFGISGCGPRPAGRVGVPEGERALEALRVDLDAAARALAIDADRAARLLEHARQLLRALDTGDEAHAHYPSDDPNDVSAQHAARMARVAG